VNLDLLEKELTRDEGKKAKPYKCTAGKTTIGIGRNLDDVGLSEEEIRFLFKNDIARVCADLDKRLPWWKSLSEARQRVLANMAFNLGIEGLLGFKNTLAKMQAGDYVGAAGGMRASLWARQVGARAERLAQMMEAG
jgi:lysozyme